MKNILLLFIVLTTLSSCKEFVQEEQLHHENFEERTVDTRSLDSLEHGITYLSVYSQIYSFSEHKKHNLTITASIRNISLRDTLYITKGQYLNTNAKPIHTYFQKPIYVAPLETLEIVIDEIDQAGDTGANFIFDWKIKTGSTEPLFEGIMISTYGAQGLSFITKGERIQ